ncbi:Sec-independent protein translocase subunit TatA [Streptacidiphilus cavernicola]|uniref:Sec-independent protein translocase protein TatA n=1 Tax=Streptacidiphilus cavernicola TaxID=3342716 RepID=A0ABV6W5C5_9ACTN
MLENRGLELIILAVVLLLLFGYKRLPDSARALGKSLRILKSEVGAMKSDGKTPEGKAEAAPAEPVVAPRTIQAAPGESASARPVADTVSQPQPTNQA